jgi:hypothetical protein
VFDSMPSFKKKTDIPEKERALVLQGRGSLGAYEAGADRVIYELKVDSRKTGFSWHEGVISVF